jgi:hypothetical protein
MNCNTCGEKLYPVILKDGYQLRYKGRLVFECRTCDRAVLIREAQDNQTRASGEPPVR